MIDKKYVEMLFELKAKEQDVLQQLKNVCDFEVYYVKFTYSTEYKAILEVCFHDTYYKDSNSIYLSVDEIESAEYVKQKVHESMQILSRANVC